MTYWTDQETASEPGTYYLHPSLTKPLNGCMGPRLQCTGMLLLQLASPRSSRVITLRFKILNRQRQVGAMRPLPEDDSDDDGEELEIETEDATTTRSRWIPPTSQGRRPSASLSWRLG